MCPLLTSALLSPRPGLLRGQGWGAPPRTGLGSSFCPDRIHRCYHHQYVSYHRRLVCLFIKIHRITRFKTIPIIIIMMMTLSPHSPHRVNFWAANEIIAAWHCRGEGCCDAAQSQGPSLQTAWTTVAGAVPGQNPMGDQRLEKLVWHHLCFRGILTI